MRLQENDEAEAAAIPVAPDENEMGEKSDEDGERRDDRIGDMMVERAEEKKDELDKIVVAPFDPPGGGGGGGGEWYCVDK